MLDASSAKAAPERSSVQLRGRIAAQNTATGVSDMFGVSRKCVQSSTVSHDPTTCDAEECQMRDFV